MEEEQEATEKRERKPMNRWIKRAGLAALATGLISGTFYNHHHDLPPIYVRKTGNGGGIATGLFVKIDEGASFSGAIVAPFTRVEGTLNGANVNLFELGNTGKINGLEVGLADFPYHTGEDYARRVNGIDIGFANQAKSFYGVRLGVLNVGDMGNYLDLGIANLSIKLDKDGNFDNIRSVSLPITYASEEESSQ